jgi:starch phosphorylase
MYSLLEDPGVSFQISIKGRAAWGATYFLPSNVFNFAPMFFLTTDTDGNDEWARSISYHLYDKDAEIKVARTAIELRERGGHLGQVVELGRMVIGDSSRHD